MAAGLCDHTEPPLHLLMSRCSLKPSRRARFRGFRSQPFRPPCVYKRVAPRPPSHRTRNPTTTIHLPPLPFDLAAPKPSHASSVSGFFLSPPRVYEHAALRTPLDRTPPPSDPPSSGPLAPHPSRPNPPPRIVNRGQVPAAPKSTPFVRRLIAGPNTSTTHPPHFKQVPPTHSHPPLRIARRN
jgi:hypothetical protein